MIDRITTLRGDIRVGFFITLISFFLYVIQWNFPFRLNVILVCVLLLSIALSRGVIFIFFLVGWLTLVKYTAIPSFELLFIGSMGILTYGIKYFFISPSKQGLFLLCMILFSNILFWVLFGFGEIGSFIFFIELISSLAYAMIFYGSILWLKRIFS